MENLEMLPEKWCIHPKTHEERKIIGEWFNKKFKDSIYPNVSSCWIFHFPRIGNSAIFAEPQKGYAEITFEQFKNMLEGEYFFKDRAELEKLFDSITGAWRYEIIDVTKEYPFDNIIKIPIGVVKGWYMNASSSNRAVLQKFFPTISEDDNNAFLRSFDVDKMGDISKELFGDAYCLQILYRQTPVDKPELKGRALYVYSTYDVETGKTESGGTYIKISKKDKHE